MGADKRGVKCREGFLEEGVWPKVFKDTDDAAQLRNAEKAHQVEGTESAQAWIGNKSRASWEL